MSTNPTRALLDLEPLTTEELEQYELYQWLEQEDARQHPIVLDEHGTLRFKPDPATVWLAEHCQDGMYLNDLWLAYHDGQVTLDAIARHYRDLGYSLGGYHDSISVAYDDLKPQPAEPRLGPRSRLSPLASRAEALVT